MISSLQNYSVHGIVNGCSRSNSSQSEIIMLSIYSAVLDKTKFIIVDLKLNRFVCTLGDDYNGLIEANKVYAAWSIDRTQVIIRVPISVESAALDFYKSISIENERRKSIKIIEFCFQLKRKKRNSTVEYFPLIFIHNFNSLQIIGHHILLFTVQ